MQLYFPGFYSYVKTQIVAVTCLLNKFLLRILVAFLLVFSLNSAKAQVCGTSGLDGPQNAVPPVNTYFPLSTTATLTAGSKSIVLNAVPPNDPNYNLSYGVTPIKSGDLILIIQMQDASFDYSNSNLYGAGSATSGPDNLGGTGYTNLNNSGKFEYVVATNDVPLTGGTLTFRGAGAGKGCVYTYTNANATATTGQKRFQVIRVPQYSNLILTANITTPPYNGSVGGLIAFDVAGTMQFNGFIVDASARGFRGGYGPKAGSGSNNSSDYVLLSNSTKSVGKGEGVGGTPRYMWDGFNQVDNGSDGLPSGSYGRGAPANGGGGGNDHNAGGGGGGNGGYGGLGGMGWQGANGDTDPKTGGGRPGSFLPTDYSRLIMGGGGGGGDANDALSGVKGGVGGGVVLINVDKIDGVGVIKANGGNGAPGTYGSSPDGAGGGGAGGSIFVRSLAASPTANLTLEAKGGRGGNTLNDNNDEHGPGGGGGGGFVYTQLPFATVVKDISKGLSGKANNGTGISHGALDGTDGQAHPFTTSDLPSHLQGGGSICYPVLTTTLTESDPGSAGARPAGTTATYTLTIQNAPTNGNAGNVEAWLNIPSSFKVSSISYSLIGDAAGTLDAAPHIGASGVMHFGNFNISPGDKVVITIVADIAVNAPTGVYHASAQATYLDPTRTNLNPFRKITGSTDPFPGYNTSYESGGISNVMGANYNGNLVSAVAEDVYINALAVTGSCDAITGGGFEPYTPGDYSSIDKWSPVNLGEIVKIVTQGISKGVAVRNGLYSIKQQIQSVEPSTNYTIKFGLQRWADDPSGCNSNNGSPTLRVRIYDPSNPSVFLLDQTENPGNFNNSSPIPVDFSFSTGATTTSLVLEIDETGPPNSGCPFFVDEISMISNLNVVYTVTNVTCNGANDGSVTLSLLTGAAAPYKVSYALNGGSYTSPTPLNPINSSGTPLVFPNLIPGNYEAKIVDANGCVNIRSFNITEPPVISLSESHIDNTCNNNTIGAIDLTVSGGTAPYTYSWVKDGVSYASTQDLNTLPPGQYAVTVTDFNNCTEQLSVDILPLTAFTLTGSQVNNSCNGGATATITLNPTGGQGPYSFTWDDGSHDQNRINLIAGNYTVIGKDGLGCEVTLTFTITEPAALSATAVPTDVSCFGGSTGSIDVTATGGTGPYAYLWSNNSTAEDLAGLTAGSYSVTVTDSKGCTATVNTTVSQPSAALSATAVPTDVSCFGGATGSIDVTATGGTGPYAYLWSNNSTAEDLAGLTAGSYSVTVTDSKGCTATVNTTVSQPSAALSATAVPTDVSCFGGATGSIDVTATGGTGPYTFAWDNGPSSEDLAGLTAGSYSVTVTDSKGCTATVNTTVSQPSAALSATAVPTDVSCFGGATGSIDVTATGGTGPYAYLWSNNSTAEDLTGLTAGSYSVTVTDSQGCTVTVSTTVSQPSAALSATAVPTDVSCFGGATGSIDVTATGGTGPYAYLWSNNSTAEDLTGLTAGSYSVTVTDSKGCTATVNTTVSQPSAALSATAVPTDVSCFGGATGSIDVTATGGTGPYAYLWSNNSTAEDLAGLTAGSYSVTVTDSQGCTATVNTTVSQPSAALSATAVPTDVSCFGGATGSIDVTATGGTGPYAYLWSNNSTAEDLAGLTAGSYSVTVTDSKGCTATVNTTVSQPSAALSATAVPMDVSCFGGATGSIDVTATGGTGPYAYLWSNNSTAEDLTGLTAGSYSVTVTDSQGCTATVNTTVSQPSAALSATAVPTDVSCFGGATGSIDVTATGGTGPYTFAWDNGPSSEDLAGLTAGSYSVTVTDSKGCTATVNTTVSQPSAALSATAVPTDVSCFGGATGSIDVTATGGTGPYAYLWSNNSTAEDLTGLTAGSYSVTVTDSKGCTATVNTTVSQPSAALSATAVPTDVSCFGGATGSIDVTATGGTGPYAYLWSNNSTAEDLTGLTAGSYSVTVTDSQGCTATVNTTVSQPSAALSATAVPTDVSCFGGATGSIDVTATGGTGPYTFAWDNGPSSEDLAGLTAGSYSVTVTDSKGCTATVNTTVSQPSAALSATAVPTDVSCFGGATGSIDVTATGGTGPYAYLWSNNSTAEDLTGLTAGSYSVTVTDSKGCTATVNTTVSQPSAALSATAVPTDVSCFGGATGSIDVTATGGTGPYAYLWSNNSTAEDLAGLTAGSYSVTVTDSQGCTATVNTTVSQPSAALSATAVPTDVSCFGGATGSIDVTATGGTGPYTFAWDNGPSSEDLAGLTAGSYSVTVTDSKGCTATVNTTVSQPSAALSATAVPTDVSCFGGATGSIDVTATGGTGPYAYLWSNNSTAEDLAGLTAGSYSVTVTDSQGCTATVNTTVSQPSAALSATAVPTDVSCFGGATGSIDVTATGGTGPYTFAWDNGPSSEDLAGLTAGSYSVTVTDSQGCTATVNTTVSQPSAALSATAVPTDVSCFGGATGSIDVTATGGTGPYAYLWSNNSTAEDLAGLTAGSYSVTVTDSKGCTATVNTTVSQPSAALSATAVPTDVSCFGGATGSIDVTATGGTGPYAYLWSNNSTAEDLAGLTAGSYSVTVTDSKGCTATVNTTVSQPSAALSATAVPTDVSCFGGATGSIDVTATGGTGPYAYLWSNNSTAEDLTGLTAGSYSVTVTDSQGCTVTVSTTVSQPSAALSATAVPTDVSCFGGATGSIDVTATGGTGPYAYLWSNNSTAEDLTGLTAGSYSVTVTDSKGCTATVNTTVSQPSAALSATAVPTDVSCFGGATGSIDVTATGGTGPYAYLWSNNSTAEDLAGLTAGSYSVTVTDSQGCTATVNTTVSQPSAALSATAVPTDVSCFGGATGSIDVTATGGTGPYAYLWSNNSTAEDLAGLTAGSYSVTVTDSKGCTATVNTTVSQPSAALSATAVPMDVSCFGGATGSIDVTATGGTGPYAYLWSNNSTAEDLTGLTAGSYSVTVTDSQGCTATVNTTVSQPSAALSATAVPTDVSCFGGATGSIDVTATGGTGPYTFAWDNGPSSEDLAGLTAGSYSVTVTDSKGCTATVNTTVSQPSAALSATAVPTDVSCFGGATGSIDVTATGGTGPYAYLWSNNSTAEDLTGLTAGSYSVTVTDSKGCTATVNTTVSQPSAALSATAVPTDVSCFGGATGSIDVTATGGTGPYAYLWSNNSTAEDLTGLTAGSYSVTVTDSQGCTATVNTTVSQPSAALSATAVPTDVSCFGGATGSIDVTATGGTGPYTFAWDNGPSSEDLAGLTAGSYSVTVTDSKGCTATVNTTVSQPSAALSATAVPTDVSCFGGATGSIDVTATGGTGPYAYLWSNNSTAEDLTGLTAGSYSVTVTDSKGCTATVNTTVSQPSAALSATAVPTDVSCFGGATGSIDVTATGGTGPYAYLWSNNSTAEDLAGLTAGSYSVTVTDSQGCTATVNTTVSQPSAALSATAVPTDVSCFGGATGSIDVTATGGTGPYTFAWDNGPSSEDLAGLTAGSYSVTVTDSKGCTATVNTTVSQPSAALSATAVPTDVSCFGGATGSIDVTATGGTGPYAYLWSNNSTAEDLAGLTAGSYSVTVTDSQGCTEILAVTLAQPLALTLTENHQDVLCYGSASGEINTNVTGGTAPYSYRWSNGATTSDLSTLTSGSYTLTVTDINGCTSLKTITISQPLAPLQLTEAHQNVNCYGDSSGSIDVTVSGGTAPYTYLWNDNSTSQDRNTVPAGIYSVVVTDFKGCTIGTQIQVNQPAAPLAITETHKNVDCFGANTGSISINTLGGTAPYSYEWSNGVEVQNLSNLSAGDYEVKVTDKNGCTTTKQIQITQPLAPLSLSETHVNNGCYSENKGKINLTVNGGTAPYAFQWSNGAATKDLEHLPPGVYNVVVTDKNGCEQTLSMEILPLQPFLINEEVEQIKCFGDASGKINLQLSGGKAPYQVNWSNGVSGLNLQNLASGSYTYTAIDALGCIQLKTITITQPQPLSAKVNVKNTTCKYSPDGAITLNVSGGTKPYRFIWNGTNRGQNSSLINVNAGVYSINIIDANNCTLQLSAEILPGNCAPSADNDNYETKEDTPIIIKTPGVIVNDMDPDDDDLRISLASAKDPEGETGDVDAGKTVFKTKNGRVILNTDGSFSYVPNKNFVGIEHFVYEATDGELKSNIAQVTIVVTQVNDPPTAVDDAFATSEDIPLNGTVAINDADPENEALTYIVTQPPATGALTLNADGTFNYVPEENYAGTVTFDYQVCDPDGLCDQAMATIVVNPVNDPPVATDDKFSLQRNGQINETVVSNDTDADGDALQFNKLSDPANGTLSFNADGTFVYQPNTDFKGIDEFTYQACDPFGLCTNATVTLVVQPMVTVNLTPQTATINEGDTLKVTAVLTESLVEDVTVYLDYSGTAQQDLDFVLRQNYVSLLIPAGETEAVQHFNVDAVLDDIRDDNETVISVIKSTSKPNFVNIGNNAVITIKDVYPETVVTTPDENPDINPDPMTSPNGDGMGNESFIIYNISKYPDNEVVIFNRWGNEVYRTKGYDNKGNSFKGIANVGILTNSNKELVDGVYYYLIYTEEGGKKKMNKGYLILKR